MEQQKQSPLLRLFRILVVCLAFSGSYGAARADDNADYRQLFSDTIPQVRTAISYLRTGNGDFAGLELETFIDRWADPALAAGDLKSLSRSVHDQASEALAYIDAGQLSEAASGLRKLREQLRKTNGQMGLTFFADCIFDANAAAVPFWVNRNDRPDLSQPSEAERVNREAAHYAAALKACDATAPDNVSKDPEYRRLIDGSLVSLGKVPTAVSNKDGGHLFRLIIELRAFDRLLMFRFG